MVRTFMGGHRSVRRVFAGRQTGRLGAGGVRLRVRGAPPLARAGAASRRYAGSEGVHPTHPAANTPRAQAWFGPEWPSSLGGCRAWGGDARWSDGVSPAPPSRGSQHGPVMSRAGSLDVAWGRGRLEGRWGVVWVRG